MISEKMIEEFENVKNAEEPADRAKKSVILIKRGIFYYLLQEQAEELAAPLSLKLKTVTENLPSGETNTVKSCGFPTSGLDKYVGKLVRLGENVVIVEGGEIVEKVEMARKQTSD